MNSEKYEIIYLPLFYNDLDKIIDYIKYELNNVIAANNLLSEIYKEINKRIYNPKSYEKYNSTRKRKNIYYRIHVKKYTIFYVVKDNKIEIRRILYNKRDLNKLI